MACKIYLRHDQRGSQRETSKSDKVFVYAPSWVKEGIQILASQMKGVEFTVLDKPTLKRGRNSREPTQQILERFKITQDFENDSLVLLQRIGRNEPKNTRGRLQTAYYQPAISDLKVIYSIKDLVRQSVIVGKDMTTFTGGYKFPKVPQKEPVYICDLTALQLQHPSNSGRLILVQEHETFEGLLDDFIFLNVVGEKRKSYDEILRLTSADTNAKNRYIKHAGFGKGSCFVDAVAYKRFVKLDVILSGLALSEVASKEGDKLNFKFLKYGTGFFAGKFVKILNSLILEAVIDGFEELFEKHEETVGDVIKCLSFPFYEIDPENKKRPEKLQEVYKIDYDFSRTDALKQTKPGKGLVTATTNCANGFVACGNAMKHKSTDGAIAKNLASDANIFCPNLNGLMKYKHLEI